jgi:hypothetical protein
LSIRLFLPAAPHSPTVLIPLIFQGIGWTLPATKEKTHECIQVRKTLDCAIQLQLQDLLKEFAINAQT